MGGMTKRETGKESPRRGVGRPRTSDVPQLRVRAYDGLAEKIDAAAKAAHRSRNNWLVAVIEDALKAQGF